MTVVYKDKDKMETIKSRPLSEKWVIEFSLIIDTSVCFRVYSYIYGHVDWSYASTYVG